MFDPNRISRQVQPEYRRVTPVSGPGQRDAQKRDASGAGGGDQPMFFSCNDCLAKQVCPNRAEDHLLRAKDPNKCTIGVVMIEARNQVYLKGVIGELKALNDSFAQLQALLLGGTGTAPGAEG
ncbi:MAG: hypothetical protein AAB066_00785 [Candidatus Margulisiibacteriota bacterium]|jgi:hypothetical protein